MMVRSWVKTMVFEKLGSDHGDTYIGIYVLEFIIHIIVWHFHLSVKELAGEIN